MQAPCPPWLESHTFTGCKIDLAGTYTLHAVDGRFTSNEQELRHHRRYCGETRVHDIAERNGSNYRRLRSAAERVKVQDLGGNTVTSERHRVTLTLTTPRRCNLTLHQRQRLSPRSTGVAHFTGCSINLANTYSLHAADAG